MSKEEINNINIMIQNAMASNNIYGSTVTWIDAYGIYHEQDDSIFTENMNNGDEEIIYHDQDDSIFFENIDHEEIQWTGQYVCQIDHSDTDIAIDLNEVSDNNNSVQH